jgi:citrate lyase beta subunit
VGVSDQAQAIVAAGARTGTGIATVDGQMVGPPFYAAAMALIKHVDTDRAASPVTEGVHR